MVLLEAGKLVHKNFINIWRLTELRGIEVTADNVDIGPLTTFTEIQADEVLQKEFPMLCQAASETGGLAIQNRGTLGGNIVNASPAADSPPALLAYDAQVQLTANSGSRWLPYDRFHLGYKEMDIHDEELLTRIRLPRKGAALTHYYRKVGTRKAQAISKVCIAAVAAIDNSHIADVRIALGSVAPIVLRCVETENTVRGKVIEEGTITRAQQTLMTEITPIDDVRSTATYRLRIASNLLADFLLAIK